MWRKNIVLAYYCGKRIGRCPLSAFNEAPIIRCCCLPTQITMLCYDYCAEIQPTNLSYAACRFIGEFSCPYLLTANKSLCDYVVVQIHISVLIIIQILFNAFFCYSYFLKHVFYTKGDVSRSANLLQSSLPIECPSKFFILFFNSPSFFLCPLRLLRGKKQIF